MQCCDLEVSTLLAFIVTWNADGAAAVSNTIGERVDGSGFVSSSETTFVSFTVSGDVLFVLSRQLLHGSKDHSKSSALLAHSFASVDTLVWHPAPFQSPGIGLGPTEKMRPKASHTRSIR